MVRLQRIETNGNNLAADRECMHNHSDDAHEYLGESHHNRRLVKEKAVAFRYPMTVSGKSEWLASNYSITIEDPAWHSAVRSRSNIQTSIFFPAYRHRAVSIFFERPILSVHTTQSTCQI